jgi:hypothetical protein
MSPHGYHRVIDMWAIKEDGSTIIIKPGLFVDWSSPAYTSETSAPKIFQMLTIVNDDGSYADI